MTEADITMQALEGGGRRNSMTRIQKRVVDRTGWRRGPWDGEPDEDRWTDEATGYPCIALRIAPGGHWCGYVGIPSGHPWFGKTDDYGCGVNVHGGITYSQHCRGSVCHVRTEGEPERFWYGFDCNHSGDAQPKRPDFFIYGSYKTLRYVRMECRRLAAQLASVRPDGSLPQEDDDEAAGGETT